MNKKSEDIIRETIAHLDDKLEEVKNLNKIVPEINQAREYLKLNANVIGNAPPSVKHTFETQEVQDTLSMNLNNWKKNLPPSPIDPTLVKTAASGASGTASEVVFDKVNSTGLVLTPEITNWRSQYNNNYSKLQEEYKRVDEIARLLVRFDPKIKDEFLDAVVKYSKIGSGIASHEDAAIIMRNVLEGLKGFLFDMVRENTNVLQAKNNVKWEHIAKYLTVGGAESNQSQFLLKKEGAWKDIWRVLSQIAKNEGEDPKELLKIYYVKWLDFLYTVLNLINPIYFLVKTIQDIVLHSTELKDKYTDEKKAPVEFGCVFCRDEDEYQEFTEVISPMGKVVEDTKSGFTYLLNEPIKTVAGPLRLVKVRKPDSLRQERGDADFNTDYPKFKKNYEKDPRFELIKRETFEMLRLSAPDFDVMACFSNIPKSKNLGIKLLG